jgi:hypothetical protein
MTSRLKTLLSELRRPDATDAERDVRLKQLAEFLVCNVDEIERTSVGWMPIETAPKDKCIVVFDGSRQINNCYWDNICSDWRTTSPAGRLFIFRHATHWMPMQQPPTP